MVMLLFYDTSGDQSHFVPRGGPGVMEIVEDLLCVGDSCPVRIPHPQGWIMGSTTQNRTITNWDYQMKLLFALSLHSFFPWLAVDVKMGSNMNLVFDL